MSAICAAIAVVAVAGAMLALPALPLAHADGPEPGSLALRFGSVGDDAGEFYVPYDAAVGPNGNIAVADRGLAGGPSIQVFHPNGTFAFKLMVGNQLIVGPVDFAPNGNIVVQDGPGIVAFHPNGTFALSYELPRPSEIHVVLGVNVSLPPGNYGGYKIVFGPNGNIGAIYDRGFVKTFHPNGTLNFEWLLRDQDGSIISLSDIGRGSYAVGPGNVLAVWKHVAYSSYGGGFPGHSVMVFHPNGTLISEFGSYGVEIGEFLVMPYKNVVFGPSGKLLVHDSNRRVQAFYPNGTFAGIFANSEYFPIFGPSGEYMLGSTLYYPNGTWAANLDRRYKFTASGEFLVGFNQRDHTVSLLHGVNPAVKWQPSSLFQPLPDSGPASFIYRPPPQGSSLTGATFMTGFGSHGHAPGEFMWPDSVAFGPGGIIAVLDWGNHRVQLFHPNGTFAFEIGSRGQGPGEFFYPNGIAFGPNRILAVADAGNHRVQLFRID